MLDYPTHIFSVEFWLFNESFNTCKIILVEPWKIYNPCSILFCIKVLCMDIGSVGVSELHYSYATN